MVGEDGAAPPPPPPPLSSNPEVLHPQSTAGLESVRCMSWTPQTSRILC